MPRFPLRHAAARLLTSRPISINARPRSFTTFVSVPLRQSRLAAPTQFQRRWATSEAEAKKEEAPISQLQPTPEEEVENAIHEDGLNNPAGSAAPSNSDASRATQIAETANATEATDDITTTATESRPVRDAVDSLRGAASSLTEGLSEQPRPRRSDITVAKDPPTPKATVYVGNLFFDVTENDINKEFGRFGPIKQARLIRDSRGLSKGFGYIEYETTEQAQAAIDDMHQQLFEGRRLMVNFAHSDAASPKRGGSSEPVNSPTKTLFVGNMSFEMTDRDLNNLFRGIRNVIDVRVAIDRRTGQPRGFAHADFVDVKSAMEALKVLNGKETYGRKLRVDYSFGPSSAPRNTPR
ncbi:hypothetical protein LTS08_001118 [Lithohypha guttulata]|nr:hypothetical protein LTS08_001118 [Lithohypha guttulata]